MTRLCPFVLGALTLAIFLPAARAEVKPNALFADNAVLQQGIDVPIWGTAGEGETVTVEFAGQRISTVARHGAWSVRLKPLAASDQPAALTIRGDNTVTIRNVLVGEVWVCSGQSNMERQLGPRPPQPDIDHWREEAAAANFPTLREFQVSNLQAGAPVPEAQGQWTVCTPQTAPNFCAVGFFFARALQAARHVPVGLLWTTWGGTQAEAWTSREALLALPEYRPYVANYDKAVAEYPAKLAQFNQAEPALLQKWQEDTALITQQNQPLPPKPDTADAAALAQWQADTDRIKKENKPLPRKPGPPGDPAKSNNSPAVLYNGMIAPLEPYAIRGVCWYQGENNSGRGQAYRALFPALIADWRQHWGEGDFPFLFVQVAPYRDLQPDIREAQLLTLKAAPRTAMVVTTDIGDANNIHPPHKAPVGERLALAARALAYGEPIEYSGPIFDAAKFAGGQAVLTFTHAEHGLEAKGGPLQGFTIAGADKKFVPAAAVIAGQTVTVSNPAVPNPVAVRYGFVNVPEVNLFNQEGLPASPFRTDVD
jgi:sialate O-acetylesterase